MSSPRTRRNGRGCRCCERRPRPAGRRTATEPPADACPPRLTWETDTSLLVAWGADVRVITIRSEAAAGAAGAAGDAPARRFGEVTAKFSVKDALVCGIAPFGAELALLW
jgi:hypothetical protein